ncbi:hypothetical protein SESBI_27492 [Sesbania bispinosa]|nr:hypothetical protein SESBI_27492 [Sesbania bispinosa]
MIPAEIEEPNLRSIRYAEEENEVGRRAELDLVDEIREMAHIREIATKERAARKYNSKVVPRSFQEDDLVMRRALKDGTTGKLAPNWEGPFRAFLECG